MAAAKDFLARHGLPLGAILLLAVISAAFSWNIGYEYRWTSDTTDTFYRIVRTLPADAPRGGSLAAALLDGFARVFAEEPVTAWYQSLFDAYLRAFHLAWGDISLAYKVQVLPLTLLFGGPAYFFFLRLTGHRGLALALAVAALLPMPLSWAGERSGLGPLWTYTRRYFHTAFLPLIALLYFRGGLGQRSALLAAMVLAGAASNLHASGVLLVEGLVLAWLMAGPISPRRAARAAGLLALAFCFSIAAVGSLWTRGLQTITHLLLSGAVNDALATPLNFLVEARQKVGEGERYLFYPPKIYDQLPGLLVDGWLLLTLVLSLAPLAVRRWRGEEHFPTLVAAAAACLLFVDFEGGRTLPITLVLPGTFLDIVAGAMPGAVASKPPISSRASRRKAMLQPGMCSATSSVMSTWVGAPGDTATQAAVRLSSGGGRLGPPMAEKRLSWKAQAM